MANYKSWSTNDLAFVIYAKYKGLKYKQIAEILDVSLGALNAQVNKINNPESYGSKTIEEKVNKAQILEAQIRSGQYPDHQKAWNDRISKVNGIKYNIQVKKEEEPIVKESQKVVEKPQELPNLLSININTEALIAVIKAWRGESA